MNALVAAWICIPLIDQALKLLVLHRLGSGSISLGFAGKVQAAQAPMWLMRHPNRPRLAWVWSLWLLSACGMVSVTLLEPSFGCFAGLILGGSFSHLLESSVRGSICDYICLRFWPAFNVADVAITVGGAGLAWTLFALIARSVD